MKINKIQICRSVISKAIMISLTMVMWGCFILGLTGCSGPSASTGSTKAPLSSSAEIKQNGQGLEYVFADKSSLSLQAISDRIIHVHYALPNQKPKESLVVRPDGIRPEHVETAKNGNILSLQTSSLAVRLDTSNGKVSFLTSSGKSLLSEAGREVTPITIKGYPLYKTIQRWSADESEAYYGLGQHQSGVMNYQGTTVNLSQVNMTAVSPFVVSSGGYGIFWDAPCTSAFSAKEQNEISFSSQAAFTFDYYFILGPDYDSIIKEYRALTGQAPMYARWTFGYMQSKERYKTQQELLDTAREFRKRGFPIDLIIQDWRYWGDSDNSKWSGMVFDPVNYPDPDEMIKILHNELNMKFMAVIWPFIGPDTDLCRELQQNNCLVAGTHFSTGKLYDAYSATARDIYWKYANKGLFQRGLDAWWMDGSEPENVRNFTGNFAYGPIESCHNAFPLVHTEGIYEHQRKVSDQKRVFILTRSVFAGQQRAAAATWSGDITASWATLAKQIPAGINYGMSGFPYWTTDIGGFYASAFLPEGTANPKYRELYTRWFQFGAFCPLFRSHGTSVPREPWQFGDEHFAILKKYCDLRYRLLPYIYSLSSEVTRNGYTLMRGLPMDFPDDRQCRNIGKEFMFGPAFLVAPVTTSVSVTNKHVISQGSLFDADGQAGGLTGSYYSGKQFNKLVLKRKDQEIDFAWLEVKNPGFGDNIKIDPVPGLPIDGFSIRWEGFVATKEAGEYTFITDVDDGVRLWIDGKLLIDDWNVNAVTEKSAAITLPADTRVPIKLEYYENTGEAEAHLSWSTPSDNNVQKPMQEVYLPGGQQWVDFWTGQTTTGGKIVRRDLVLDIMPLYIKAGSIVPMGPYLQYATEKQPDPLELRIYPGKDASFTLYEDENNNYNYEKGAFALIPITWNDKAQTLTIGKRKGSFPGMLAKRTFDIVLVKPDQGVGETVTAKPDKTVQYDGTNITVQMKK
jgi:alpha-D-xyloside xylohydrolase